MATLTRRVLKLVAIAGTIPAAGIAFGYGVRSLQASDTNSLEPRIYKVCDLPVYPSQVIKPEIQLTSNQPIKPKNVVEEEIGVARRAVQGFLLQFSDSYEKVKTTLETGYEHTKVTLDYIQNNPGDLPRIGFITVAGLGGVVLGYRGGILKKLTYGSLAAVSTAALCYPQKTVDLSLESWQYGKDLWRENVGDDVFVYFEKYWPFGKDGKSGELQTSEQSSSSSGSQKQQKVIGDLGQSNPADKDLYSTRTS